MINYEVIFKVDEKENKIDQLKTKSGDPNFWNDQKNAQVVLQEMKQLQDWVDLWMDLDKKYKNLVEFIELAEMENDDSLIPEIENRRFPSQQAQ